MTQAASSGHALGPAADGMTDPRDDDARQQEATRLSPDATHDHINTAQAKPPVPPPPNGGYGWVCTAASATINAHTWGMNSSYGVFLAHYLATDAFPGTSTLGFAFVGSLSISLALFSSPLATLTVRHAGTHVCLFVGVVLQAGSLIAASLATEVWQLCLSQGVCFGVGMGFLFIGSVGIVPQWFTTKRSFASAIAVAGSGLGGLVYSLAAGAMIPAIGLPWTFRVLGILAFVANAISSALLRDRNKIIGSSFAVFDVNILFRLEYFLLAMWGWFTALAYVVLIFSLSHYANTIGLNASQASVISAVLNAGQFLGRPIIGYYSDSLGRLNMAASMTLLAGLFALALWIPARTYALLILYALIGGSVAGTFWCTVAPVTAEVVGLKHVPSGLNLLWLAIALPSTFSEPIALEIVRADRGRYLGAQLWTAGMFLAAAACMLLLRGWKIAELDEVARMKAEGVGVDDVEEPEQALVVGRQRMWQELWKWRKV